MNDGPPTLHEHIAIVLSRTFQPDDVGFTGLTTGEKAAMFGTMIPACALQLARLTHAPDLTVLLAGWCVNPSLHLLERLPDAEFDPRLLALECDARDMGYPPLYSFRRGDVTVGFSSGVQVDREGNLNTVEVRPPGRTVRLVGPILIPEHLGLFGREIIMMAEHDPRRLVKTVDHRTGVGFPGGRAGRAELGLRGGGPEFVVTPLGIFGFDAEGAIRLRARHPGIELAHVVEATGFEVVEEVDERLTAPVTEQELATMRTAVDPYGHLRRAPEGEAR